MTQEEYENSNIKILDDEIIEWLLSSHGYQQEIQCGDSREYFIEMLQFTKLNLLIKAYKEMIEFYQHHKLKPIILEELKTRCRLYRQCCLCDSKNEKVECEICTGILKTKS